MGCNFEYAGGAWLMWSPGELIWAATKSLFSGMAILIVISGLGLTQGPMLFWVLPAIVLTGLAFAALGLIWNALAPPTIFHVLLHPVYYAMTLISGVFFRQISCRHGWR